MAQEEEDCKTMNKVKVTTVSLQILISHKLKPATIQTPQTLKETLKTKSTLHQLMIQMTETLEKKKLMMSMRQQTLMITKPKEILMNNNQLENNQLIMEKNNQLITVKNKLIMEKNNNQLAQESFHLQLEALF